ncbi:MAG: SUMF1/EgtB/PvdO family nonheme iron enzyme [Planctomycetota bacterium]|nr:SUMF1/EgtB/PvdO family nonheme iron enzyme [Planctomycetota bacterium]
MLRYSLFVLIFLGGVTNNLLGQATSAFCVATPNSTGVSASLSATFGSGIGSNLHLEVVDGVPNEYGYFLAGGEATPGVVISNGLLCLTGTPSATVYRYNVSGTEWNSLGRFDAAGVMQNLGGTSSLGSGFDVPSTIPDTIPILITAGDTWYFQYWHRDTPAGLGSSNFSTGLAVTFGLLQPIPGMSLIPAGSFAMGSDAAFGSPYHGTMDTQPIHQVTISEDFWMAQHETTHAEFEALMGAHATAYPGANVPVHNVSWHRAREYCARLTLQEEALGHLPSGYEYRLPTEAEWEYACRAGTTTEFNVGPALLCGDARISYSAHSMATCMISPPSPTDVGSYAPNAWGLHDMHGNMWEWCLDALYLYNAGAVMDPLVTTGTFRVVRGGTFGYPSSACRSASRYGFRPSTNNLVTIGFRVVLGRILIP